MARRTVSIDGARLKREREERFTQDALITRVKEIYGVRLGISTLQRAEAGSASRKTLGQISYAMGVSPDHYLVVPERETVWRPVFDLTGKWRVYFLEDDVGIPPYPAVEALFLQQNGSYLSGTYEPVATEHPEGHRSPDAFSMEGRVAENLVMGSYWKPGVAHPQGAGVYQLLVTRDGNWAQGFCLFYADDGRLMASPNLWIREGAAEYALMRKQADQLFREQRVVFRHPQ